MFERLPPQAVELHGELVAHFLAEAEEQAVPPGGLVTKRLGRGIFYYYQVALPGSRRQIYLGPASEALEEMVERFSAARAEPASEREQVARTSSMLRSAGVATMAHAPFRVLRGLSDAGVFALGGVLVGAHAGALIGNLLGVKSGDREADGGPIEIACARDETAQLSVLERLERGFAPTAGLSSIKATSSFEVRGKSVRVELLVNGSAHERGPVVLPLVGGVARPVQHLAFLLEEFESAAVVGRGPNGGCCLVSVPEPARFALHRWLLANDWPRVGWLLEAIVGEQVSDLRRALAEMEAQVAGTRGLLQRRLRELAAGAPALARQLRRALTAV